MSSFKTVFDCSKSCVLLFLATCGHVPVKFALICASSPPVESKSPTSVECITRETGFQSGVNSAGAVLSLALYEYNRPLLLLDYYAKMLSTWDKKSVGMLASAETTFENVMDHYVEIFERNAIHTADQLQHLRSEYAQAYAMCLLGDLTATALQQALLASHQPEQDLVKGMLKSIHTAARIVTDVCIVLDPAEDYGYVYRLQLEVEATREQVDTLTNRINQMFLRPGQEAKPIIRGVGIEAIDVSPQSLELDRIGDASHARARVELRDHLQSATPHLLHLTEPELVGVAVKFIQKVQPKSAADFSALFQHSRCSAVATILGERLTVCTNFQFCTTGALCAHAVAHCLPDLLSLLLKCGVSVHTVLPGETNHTIIHAACKHLLLAHVSNDTNKVQALYQIIDTLKDYGADLYALGELEDQQKLVEAILETAAKNSQIYTDRTVKSEIKNLRDELQGNSFFVSL